MQCRKHDHDRWLRLFTLSCVAQCTVFAINHILIQCRSQQHNRMLIICCALWRECIRFCSTPSALARV